MEKQIEKFLELAQARQDKLAKQREAVLRHCSKKEKARYHTGYEHGVFVAGRQAEAAEIALDLEEAFGVAQ